MGFSKITRRHQVQLQEVPKLDQGLIYILFFVSGNSS